MGLCLAIVETILVLVKLTTLADLRQSTLWHIIECPLIILVSWTAIRLLHLRQIWLIGQISRSHLSSHSVLRWSNRLLIIICASKSIGIWLRWEISPSIQLRHHLPHLPRSIGPRHIRQHGQTRATLATAHKWLLNLLLHRLLQHLNVIIRPLLHIPSLVFFWGRPRDFPILRHKSGLELLNLLVILD